MTHTASFKQLYQAHRWREIPHCPGRFIAPDLDDRMDVADLAGGGHDRVKAFNSPRAHDTVLVLKIPGGGIISYRRADGSCLHTLNTDSGFQRKLADLGIEY